MLSNQYQYQPILHRGHLLPNWPCPVTALFESYSEDRPFSGASLLFGAGIFDERVDFSFAAANQEASKRAGQLIVRQVTFPLGATL
jgi:hypothetical protein